MKAILKTFDSTEDVETYINNLLVNKIKLVATPVITPYAEEPCVVSYLVSYIEVEKKDIQPPHQCGDGQCCGDN